jgi:hypothetical protein
MPQTQRLPQSRPLLRAPVVLMNEAALELPMEDMPNPESAQVIVAGQSLVRMTLAELSIPGAQMIWTDFRQSASLRKLHGAIQDLGGLDRMVMAADGDEAEAMFSLMCAILTFLPALRRNGGGQIVLAVTKGQAVGSLQAFLQGLMSRLARDGVTVSLQVHDRRKVTNAA